jgi:hypothetical protein
MSQRKIVILVSAVGLAGAGVIVALALVLVSRSGSASPPVEPPAVRLPPETVPLRPIVERTPNPPATGEPAPPAQDCHSGGDEALTGAQIVSYYGNPYTADMGILGELAPQELVERLDAHARLYDDLNGPIGVQPALHLVYGTAQSDPGREGLYLLYVDEETLREYIQLACDNDLLIFLDLQIGHSDVQSEITKILPYIEQPHVHAALDPEFAMPEGKVPGESIGSLDAVDVNIAQAILEEFVEQHGLREKVLIVHQFTAGMLTRPELLEDYPRVKLVIDMDGFGPSDIKRVKYGWYAAPAEHSGIKLFFGHDTDLLSEEEVVELEPDVIIYQ